MSRLTDNDKKFGQITYARTDWRPWRMIWSSGGDNGDEREPRNDITVYAFGWCARVYLPNVIRSYRVKHIAQYWDAATIERLGRNWYYEVFPREYGFCLNEGFLTIFFGAQTHDSITTQSKSWFLPWTQWQFVRQSLYNPDGSHFWTEDKNNRNFKIESERRHAVPKVEFLLDDYDGERIKATCYIEEREWHFGTGYFKWLKWFRKPMIRRYLTIKFDKETGTEKGSWKGGTVGHSIDISADEAPEQAMRRYCDKEHRAKGGKYKMTFIGVAP